jgi:alpha-L-fucosidase
MRTILDRTFKTDLVLGGNVTASSARLGHGALAAIDGDSLTYWTTQEGIDSATLEVDLKEARTFDRAILQEQVRVGQRVEKFRLEAWTGSAWISLTDGTTIGYKRLLRFPAVRAKNVRLVIEKSRTSPTVSRFGLFKSPR